MLEWHKICCPIDFSEASREAMFAAVDLAKQFNAELHLLHVYQLPGISFPEATVFSGQEALQQLVEMIDRSLSEWKEQAHARGCTRVETHAAMGVPYAEILRFVEQNGCDLLVMGSHGRTALMRAIMGSVAERVVRHATCPVLTVRPKGARVAAHAEPTAHEQGV